MAEYLIKSETLTSMADKIRVLSGTSGTMTTAQMDSKIGEANTEVASQANLIAQIVSALENKGTGSGSGGNSGGSSGGALEAVSVTVSFMPDPGSKIYYIDDTVTLRIADVEKNTTYMALKGSILATELIYNDLPNCTRLAGTAGCAIFVATG